MPEPISKELNNGKTVRHRLKFIDNFRFMSTSLSSLVDNLSEKLHSDKRKDCKSELHYTSVKVIFQCLECKKNYKKDFNKELIKRLPNTTEFCNADTNKFILLLRKGVYPCEYVDSWEIFNETLLSYNKSFHSELNLEDITDKNYVHAQKVYKNNLRSLSEKLLLVDVFENFRNKFFDTYELDPAHFLSAPRLVMQYIDILKQIINMLFI